MLSFSLSFLSGVIISLLFQDTEASYVLILSLATSVGPVSVQGKITHCDLINKQCKELSKQQHLEKIRLRTVKLTSDGGHLNVYDCALSSVTGDI